MLTIYKGLNPPILATTLNYGDLKLQAVECECYVVLWHGQWLCAWRSIHIIAFFCVVQLENDSWSWKFTVLVTFHAEIERGFMGHWSWIIWGTFFIQFLKMFCDLLSFLKRVAKWFWNDWCNISFNYYDLAFITWSLKMRGKRGKHNCLKISYHLIQRIWKISV